MDRELKRSKRTVYKHFNKQCQQLIEDNKQLYHFDITGVPFAKDRCYAWQRQVCCLPKTGVITVVQVANEKIFEDGNKAENEPARCWA